jgi:excisionase family DNA binding protein
MVAADKEVYSPDEFADRLRVPPTTVRRWLREGRIKGRKIGRRWFVPHSEIEKTINPPDPEDWSEESQ